MIRMTTQYVIFFFFYFFKFYFIFKLHNIVLVLPNIEMNLPWVMKWQATDFSLQRGRRKQAKLAFRANPSHCLFCPAHLPTARRIFKMPMIHSIADQLSWNHSPALSGYVVNRVEWGIVPAFQWPQPRGQTGWRGGEVIWGLAWNISIIDFCLTDMWVKENTVFSTNLSLTLSENGIHFSNNAYFSKW